MTMQTFTVHAKNEFGEASAEVSIDITELKPKVVVPVPSLKWTEGEDFKPIDFAGFFDGQGMEFFADNLPDGFAISKYGVFGRLP